MGQSSTSRTQLRSSEAHTYLVHLMGSKKAVVAGMLITAVACGDSTLGKLSTNITRDSALKVLAVDATVGDTMPHIYREDVYLVDGKFYKIGFYTPTDRKLGSDTVGGAALPDEELTPLVFVNDTLTGWGWDHWREVATGINVPVTTQK